MMLFPGTFILNWSLQVSLHFYSPSCGYGSFAFKITCLTLSKAWRFSSTVVISRTLTAVLSVYTSSVNKRKCTPAIFLNMLNISLMFSLLYFLLWILKTQWKVTRSHTTLWMLHCPEVSSAKDMGSWLLNSLSNLTTCSQILCQNLAWMVCPIAGKVMTLWDLCISTGVLVFHTHIRIAS